MYKYPIICIILLIAVHYSNNLGAQEKFEKESRIRERLVVKFENRISPTFSKRYV